MSATTTPLQGDEKWGKGEEVKGGWIGERRRRNAKKPVLRKPEEDGGEVKLLRGTLETTN
jgi:hypothetical protein